MQQRDGRKGHSFGGDPEHSEMPCLMARAQESENAEHRAHKYAVRAVWMEVQIRYPVERYQQEEKGHAGQDGSGDRIESEILLNLHHGRIDQHPQTQDRVDCAGCHHDPRTAPVSRPQHGNKGPGEGQKD